MPAMKREILSAAKAAGLFGVARRRTASAVRILCYHGIWLGDRRFPGDAMFMQADTFRRRLAYIRHAGYPVVKLADAARALKGEGPKLPPAAVVITIDDGWLSTYQEMLPALVAHGMPATLYSDTAQLTNGRVIAHVMARYLDRIAGMVPVAHRDGLIDLPSAIEARRVATDLTLPYEERVAAVPRLAAALDLDIAPMLAARAFEYMTPDELRHAHKLGLDIQLHTHDHTLGDMSDAVIQGQIRRNRECLADVLGTPQSAFQHFCYPSGVTDPTAAQTLADLGMATSVTTNRGLAWPHTPLQMLPRLHDGENVSDLEFEAELSGFSDLLRTVYRGAQRFKRPAPATGDIKNTRDSPRPSGTAA